MADNLNNSTKTLKSRRRKQRNKFNATQRSQPKVPLNEDIEENIFAHYRETVVSPKSTPLFGKSKDHISVKHQLQSTPQQMNATPSNFPAKKKMKMDMSSLAHLEVIQETNSMSDSFVSNSETTVLANRNVSHGFLKQTISQKKIGPTFEELQKQRRSLSIFNMRKKLMSLFAKESCIILKGETGCGKTTQIPQYLLEGGFIEKFTVAVTQPRRVAAITISERVASEVGTKLGKKVGYCVRFEDVTSAETKIKYVTDGILLRESLSDSLLLSYSWVILDEAHERTIHTDVLFGIVKAAQTKRNKRGLKPLKIIIMSATLDEEKFFNFFSNASVIDIPGREYIIEISNSRVQEDDYVSLAVSTVVHIHENEEKGDILVFLTGEEEIESAVMEVKKIAVEILRNLDDIAPMALYAALPSEAQKDALRPLPSSVRKVIFATNIAETSLTIPGIKYVVDSGMVKTKSYNPVSGLDWLKVERISKAQANQRAGRAGRESKGSCYRLYTLEEYNDFKDFPIPEIFRCSLSSVLLQIIALGISNLKKFDFLDRPPEENIDAAIEQLTILGAVQGDSSNVTLTELGAKMVKFPLDPRFSKILIMSSKYGCTKEILIIVSLLSVESVFLSSISEREVFQRVRVRFHAGVGDHYMLLNLFKGFHQSKFSFGWCLENYLHFRNMRKAVEIRKQLREICDKVGIPLSSCLDDTTAVRKCLATGLFMNAACLHKKNVYKTIGSKEKVYVHPSSSLFKSDTTCCIYTDLVQTSKCYMRNLSVVDEDWLIDAAPEYFKHRNFKRFELVTV